MVILITGASHTGKTLLAQKLLERFHFPYLSLDHLKMGLIRSGQTDLTPYDDLELTPYLWRIVREMIRDRFDPDELLWEFQSCCPAGSRSGGKTAVCSYQIHIFGL